MKIALIGATGNVGSRILKETLDRGHHVTAIMRNPEKLPKHKNLTEQKCDLNHGDEILNTLSGHNVVISSVPFNFYDTQKLIDIIKESGVKRYIVVGGAGSLQIKPGLDFVDSADFPPAGLLRSRLGRDLLNQLRNEKELEWTMLSPPMDIGPGERTGKFRIGTDQLIFNEEGKSTISYEDFAVALVDELENPKFVRNRLTIGY